MAKHLSKNVIKHSDEESEKLTLLFFLVQCRQQKNLLLLQSFSHYTVETFVYQEERYTLEKKDKQVKEGPSPSTPLPLPL